MNKKSFSNEWKIYIDEKLENKNNKFGMIAGYPGVVAQAMESGGRFSGWDLIAMPEGLIESDLDLYINIACIYKNNKYAELFLSWANESADRALSDIRFSLNPDDGEVDSKSSTAMRGWKVEGVFPGNHGRVLAAACFARALRSDSSLNNADLLQAADEIAESAVYGGAKNWDYMAQDSYLRSIRLCLLAGDVSRAQYFLKKIKRKFKYSFVHQQWLQSLCDAIENADGKFLKNEFVEKFENFFDEVRNPNIRALKGGDTDGKNILTNISILRFELAVIKNLYILRVPLQGSWGEVLNLISA